MATEPTVMVVGQSYNLSTTATINGATEFEELKIKGILDFTAAMQYANITYLMDTWKNSLNINRLKDIDLRSRQYYLIDNPNSVSSVIVPDFLIVEGSIVKISPSTVELVININSPLDLDGIKDYLRVAGLNYILK